MHLFAEMLIRTKWLGPFDIDVVFNSFAMGIFAGMMIDERLTIEEVESVFVGQMMKVRFLVWTKKREVQDSKTFARRVLSMNSGES